MNGAVECNGSQYNFSDFDSNLQSLFEEGKLPYLPISEFDSMVTNQGGCDSFGYGTNELTLYPLELYQGSHYGTAYYSNVYDWETIEPDPTEAYILHGVKIYDKDTHEELVGYTVKHHPLIGYDQWQLHNENDEYSSDIVSPSFSSGDPITLSNGGEFQSTTYFKVPKKLSRVLVRCKKPTEDDKSWYNVYADGWVEQGGVSTVLSGTGQIIFRDTLQVQLQNNIEYFISSSFNWGNGASRAIVNSYLISNNGKTINIVAETLNQSITTGTGKFIWEVKGYADPTEYTKDKWNYQNIQVERCMVQLFNSTTDTAVATCNQVLADVSALNQGDYVIETQIPTPENNYTWYRLYKSGWVEQGGTVKGGFSQSTNWNYRNVSLPIEMIDNSYINTFQATWNFSYGGQVGQDKVYATTSSTATTMQWAYILFSSATTMFVNWQVSGMSAQGNN